MIDTITGNVTLDDDQYADLLKQVDIYYNSAIGYHQGELGVKARTAWEYYYGRLPDPITKGSSKWVDRSVWEAVNGSLQELVSVFTSGEDAVRFAPFNHADADKARAATKMVNKVLLRDNPGYNVLHDAFKECLVARNSFVKRYWGKHSKMHTEQFEDLTKDEFDIYLTGIEGEIVEMKTEIEESEDKNPANDKYSGEVTYEKTHEGVKVEYVPFEFVLVEPTATCIKDANYMAHRVRKSKGELKEMGFDVERVEEMNAASSDIEAGIMANARVNNLSPLNVSDVLSVGDSESDKVWLHEHYIKTSIVSGFSEILQVFTINNQILEVNRVNEFPFETFTPFPIPGTIWGESVFDITKDIQDLTTTLVRGIIDNIQNANFRRYQAVRGSYDRESLLNNRPGGVVEVQAIGNVVPFEHHQLPDGVSNLLEYIEGKKEQRTGVSKIGQGLDPSVFRNDNSFATVNMMMSAAQNRLRMVARNIAQRGIMELMTSIYSLIKENGKKPIEIETLNGTVQIEPSSLPSRHEMIVAVAVGDSERRERAQALQSLLMMMQQPSMAQFFQPNNAYFLATQTMEAMGVYDVENFLTPPNQVPPPQPSPQEQLQLQMAQEQIKHQQAQTQKLVTDVINENKKFEFEQIKAADETHDRREASLSKQDMDADSMTVEERKLQLEAWKLRIEEQKLELKRQELLLEAQLETAQNRAVGLGNS